MGSGALTDLERALIRDWDWNWYRYVLVADFNEVYDLRHGRQAQRGAVPTCTPSQRLDPGRPRWYWGRDDASSTRWI
jgi:hypothetical protein